MRKKTAILVALLATFLCIASLSPFASAQPCDHNLTVLSLCCEDTTTEGWFYNGTGWHYSPYCAPCKAYHDHTPLFHLMDYTAGKNYYGFCINYTVPIEEGDVFNASIYTAEPTCKNNSIAYILNSWTIDCAPAHCANVSAGQSAVWYFSYIDETFCGLGEAKYNHTAEPPVESYWIPNCTAHPEACTFINASINQSVPYNVTITPNAGNYVKGTPIPLEAEVDYCLEDGENVTVVFKTDCGTFSESGTNVYKNQTINGKRNATLVCNLDSANVTVQVEDMKWFEIVDPTGCPGIEPQPTLRIINLTDDANFTFSDAPVLGSWEGYVYEDPNCNCGYDDEQGVPNVNVSLHNASGLVDTTKTNDTGYYLFTNLTPGLYWADYDTGDLPQHLSPKCDDDTPEGGLIVDKYTSEEYEVPEGGRYRHDFAVESEADIDIEKLVDGVKIKEVTHNQTVTYTLNITNTGEVNLTNIMVVDTLPADITWADAANPVQDSVSPDGKTITWKSTLPAVLEPDKWFVISFDATVNEDAECDKTHRNWAKVNATSDWGDVGPKDDYADVYIECSEKVPVLTPFGIAALIGLLSLVVILSMSKSMRRKRG